MLEIVFRHASFSSTYPVAIQKRKMVALRKHRDDIVMATITKAVTTISKEVSTITEEVTTITKEVVTISEGVATITKEVGSFTLDVTTITKLF